MVVFSLADWPEVAFQSPRAAWCSDTVRLCSLCQRADRIPVHLASSAAPASQRPSSWPRVIRLPASGHVSRQLAFDWRTIEPLLPPDAGIKPHVISY